MSATIRTAALAVAASIALVPAIAPTASAAAKPNLRACYDGNCKITITKKVSFRIDPSFVFTKLTISFNASGVSVQSSGPGVSGSSYFSEGSTSTLNGITFSALSLSKKKAVLRLSTQG
ncbi:MULTISPECIES: hypothetical protein [unclassified Nonomuraea]|uniref:hypothetical protein n=1 Tax=unclassified Nonomuraea TaxID=2593643 RepID=UPI00340B0436